MRLRPGLLAAVIACSGAVAAAGEPHGAWLELQGSELRLVPGVVVDGVSLLPEDAAVASLSSGRRVRLPAADVLPGGDAWARVDGEAVRVEAGPDEFDAFVAEEGLDHVLLWRTERALDDVPGVAWVRQRADLVAGAPRVAAGRGLALRRADSELLVTLDGRPVPGLQVVARSPDGTRERREGETDANGAVRLVLAPGEWIATTAHASDEPDADGAWSLSLASLAFVVDDAGERESQNVKRSPAGDFDTKINEGEPAPSSTK
jgi:hypothetical protein